MCTTQHFMNKNCDTLGYIPFLYTKFPDTPPHTHLLGKSLKLREFVLLTKPNAIVEQFSYEQFKMNLKFSKGNLYVYIRE